MNRRTRIGLEHVDAMLAWGEHMLNDHPLLIWFWFCYFVLSALVIAALASAVSA
jgi:hypothetical protein